ncbi:acid protease [Stipitochalara longipes BDJ]|nr:acid protease [Stipitochalara longipes BDJ]
MFPLLYLAVFSFICPTILAYPANILPLHNRKSSHSRRGFSSVVTSLVSTGLGQFSDVEIDVGGQSFLVEIDLGSSDTWILGTGYECISPVDNSVLPQSACGYANSTYNISPTFSKIANETLGVFYGAGIVAGQVGYETVTLAGVTIPKQEVGIASSLTSPGDGYSSGLLGLAYPAITSAHPGTTIDNTTFLYNRVPYNPVVFNMAAAGLIEPFFSLAIERTPFNSPIGPGGFFALGEVAPVAHAPLWARTPVVILPQIPINVTGNKSQRSYWALEIKGVVSGPGSITAGVNFSAPPSPTQLGKNTTSFNAVLDNGNQYTWLPTPIAEQINAYFSPPATPPVPGSGDPRWKVQCNATAPVFGVEIDNQIFWHDPRDMLFNGGDGTCTSAVGRAEDISLNGVSAAFLGLQFFKNVLGVFDFGDNEIRLAARVY